VAPPSPDPDQAEAIGLPRPPGIMAEAENSWAASGTDHNDKVTGNYGIRKSLIRSNFLSLMQRKRFGYSPGLEALPALLQEIASLKYHLTPSCHEVRRDQGDEDLVP